MTSDPAHGQPLAGRRLPGGRKGLFFLVSAAVLLVILAVTFETRAGVELDKARSLVRTDDWKAADRHYFQALNWYAPWGSSQTAADELLALGLAHLREGHRTEAFESLLRLRSGLIAARSFYQPRRDLLEAATPLIALYLAERKLGEDADREAVFRQAVVYQTLYSEAASGREHWLYVVVFSFLLWVGAAFYLVFAYFGQKGPLTTSLRLRVVYVPLAVFVYGYLMWLFAMSMS